MMTRDEYYDYIDEMGYDRDGYDYDAWASDQTDDDTTYDERPAWIAEAVRPIMNDAQDNIY